MALIPELLRQGRTFSFEFFPPHGEEEREQLETTIKDLEPLGPSFVSVTYRGGASSRAFTTQVVLDLRRNTSITPMPHLTCVAHPRAELVEILGTFADGGMENVLALGGDPLPDADHRQELSHALELVELARSVGFASIGVAAHPAGHPRSPDRATDREHLAAKLRLADFAITQFFFHVDEYRRLVQELADLGVDRPVIPGIMPILSLRSVARMAEMNGYAVPDDVVARLAPAEDDPQEFRKVGIALAAELCSGLLEAGAPGLHFFTLNRSRATRDIYTSMGLARITS